MFLIGNMSETNYFAKLLGKRQIWVRHYENFFWEICGTNTSVKLIYVVNFFYIMLYRYNNYISENCIS